MSPSHRRNPEAMKEHIAQEIEQIRAQLERLRLFAEASANQEGQADPTVARTAHVSSRSSASSSYTLD
jgi:hypothetical protein